ncbi:MAG: hypothetical protein ACI86C_001622, partial [Candidatus Latescibacterota bacterium]
AARLFLNVNNFIGTPNDLVVMCINLYTLRHED